MENLQDGDRLAIVFEQDNVGGSVNHRCVKLLMDVAGIVPPLLRASIQDLQVKREDAQNREIAFYVKITRRPTDKGFYGITCWSEKHPEYVAFAGKTAQGISIHSTLDEVKEAYGEPSQADEQEIPQSGRLLYLCYESQNLSFGNILAKCSR